MDEQAWLFAWEIKLKLEIMQKSKLLSVLAIMHLKRNEGTGKLSHTLFWYSSRWISEHPAIVLKLEIIWEKKLPITYSCRVLVNKYKCKQFLWESELKSFWYFICVRKIM